MEPRKDKKAIIVAVIIGFIAGLAAGRLFPESGTVLAPSDTTNSGEMIAPNGTIDSDGNVVEGDADSAGDGPNGAGDVVVALPLPTESSVSVSDQTAGDSVMLDSLELKERSWAVIYEDSRGRPGNILGAHRYMVGVHTNVPVELQRPTEAGNVYYAMIHLNDSDDQFDHTLDRAYTTADGSPLMVRFVAE